MSSVAGFFERFPNKTFLETGTCRGDGTLLAVQAGFAEIHTIEQSESLLAGAREKLKDFPQVKTYLGKSEDLLEGIISGIRSPITFFLDAHAIPELDGTLAVGGERCPLMKELDIIGRHPVRGHIVLVDDIRAMDGSILGSVSFNLVLRKLMAIDPSYVFEIGPGVSLWRDFPNEILIARPRR